MKYYNLNKNQLESELETDLSNGLSDVEVAKRLKVCGYNVQNSVMSAFSVDFQFINTSILIALASVVHLLLAVFQRNFQQVYFAVALVVIGLSYGVFSFLYFKNINRHNRNSMKDDYGYLAVIRDSKVVNVPYKEIVYGDVVQLKKGDYIPFDGIVLDSSDALIDESAFGFADLREKKSGIINNENSKLSELYNTVFCGSFVSSGALTVVVTDVAKRVYISKSNSSFKTNNSLPKSFAYARMILLVMIVGVSVFNLLSCVVSGDFFVGIINCVLLVAFISTDFLVKYLTVTLTESFTALHDDKLYVKSPSSLQMINSTDVLLVDSSFLTSDRVEITGFISDDGKFKTNSEINKNNFGVFLYSAFCNDSDSSSFDSAITKILKKINIDFSEIESLCPVISSYSDDNSNFKTVSRVYDGKDMIILRGDFHRVTSMCEFFDIDQAELNKLIDSSTEIIAVAAKNASISSSEISLEQSGYRFIGVIGVKRSLSNEIKTKVSRLKKCNVNTVALFNGHKTSALNLFGEGVSVLSVDEFLNADKSEISKCVAIYNCNNDFVPLLKKYRELGLQVSYFADYSVKDNKAISFKSIYNTHLQNADADVVCSPDFDSVFKVFAQTIKCAYSVNNVVVNMLALFLVMSVCGLLFSIVTHGLLFNSVSLLFLCLITLPVTSLCVLYLNDNINSFKRFYSLTDLMSKCTLLPSLFVTAIFVICVVLFNLFFGKVVSVGLLLIALSSFLVDSNLTKQSFLFRNVILLFVSYLPTLILIVLLLSPASFIFGVTGLNIFHSLLAFAVGVMIRLFTRIISISAKN